MPDFVQTVGTAPVIQPAYLLSQILATTPTVPSTAFAIDQAAWYYNPGDGSGWKQQQGATGPAPQQTTVQVTPLGFSQGTQGGGALSLTNTGNGATASAIASVETAASAWGKGRLRIDTILNMAVSQGWTFLAADDNTSVTKFEIGATTGSVPPVSSANFSVRVGGTVKTQTMSLPFTSLPTAGNDFQYAWFWDVSAGVTAAVIGIAIFDQSGNKVNAFVTSAINNGQWNVTTAGFLRINHVPIANGFGGSQACLSDGFAIYSGAPPDHTFASSLWTTRPATGDTGIVYMSLQNDANTGTSPTVASAQVGTTGLTLTSGQYTWTVDSTSAAWGGNGVAAAVSELAGQFIAAVSGTLQMTAATFAQGSTTPLGGRSYTWNVSGGGSISGTGLYTAPASPTVGITITATDNGVVGAIVGTAVNVYSSLANAATAAGVFWTCVTDGQLSNELPYSTNYPLVWAELANPIASISKGGMAVEEIGFQEHRLLDSTQGGALTWVGNTPTLTFSPTPLANVDAQIAKAVGVGQLTQMRCYMFTGNPGGTAGPGGSGIAAPLFSTTPPNATAVSNLLNLWVSQSIAHYIANHGTAGSGNGVLQYCVNEFMEPWYNVQAISGGSGVGWSPNIWYMYLGTNWIIQWLQAVHTADSTAHAAFIFNNIETASATNQQANVLGMLRQVAVASGIPSTIAVLVEGHAGGGGYTYTNNDMSQLNSWNAQVAALGFKVGVAEYDNTDTLAQNQGAAGYPVRDAQNITNLTQLFNSYSSLWPQVYSWGNWSGLADSTSWINNPPNPGSPYIRPDGTQGRVTLLDGNYVRKGGAGSAQDVYGTEMSLFAVKAA